MRENTDQKYSEYGHFSRSAWHHCQEFPRQTRSDCSYFYRNYEWVTLLSNSAMHEK